MPLTGFEPANPACDQPQTLALDRSASGISTLHAYFKHVYDISLNSYSKNVSNKVVQKIETRILYSIAFLPERRAVYGQGGAQLKI
jgi:hypothetical protein